MISNINIVYWKARSFLDHATKDAIFENVDDDVDNVKNVTKNKRSLESLDDDRDSKILKSDLTAGEFYRGMKDTFSL
jgi:hypothetical protein